MIGHRDYTLHETVRYTLRFPSVVSYFGDVEQISVSTWQRIKTRR